MISPELQLTFFHGYRPKGGDVVVEIGAGAGGETADLARMVGPGGFVLAVEPHPTSFGMLQANSKPIQDLGLKVSIVNAAVLEEAGEAWISNDGSLLRDHLVPEDYPGALPVEATTLDRVCSKLKRIDYLKMNIEGAEVAALRGGKKTLAKTRNIVVSCHDFLGMPTKEETTSILLEAGFVVEGRANAEDSCRADYLYGVRE